MSNKKDDTTALDERVTAAADDLLDASFQALEDRNSLGSVETIHQIRVGMKRLRAFLRLIRSALADESYRELNACCRNLAADLSGQRDADVALETLRALVPEETALIGRMAALLHGSSATSVSRPPDWKGIEARLVALKQQLHADLRSGMRCRDLETNLRKSFRQCIQMWREARHDSSEEVLHEWRKRVKRVYYQSLLLSGDKKAGESRRLKQLSDSLGDLHDLDMLAERLERERRYFWLDELLRANRQIESKRNELHKKSVREGKHLFDGKSAKTLSKRLVRKSHWC